MSLHPQCEALLKVLAARKEPTVAEMTPREARMSYGSRALLVQPTAPRVAKVSNLSIDGLDAQVGLRVYRPLGIEEECVLPALVYFHGGGWLLGNLDTHDTLCRELCNDSNVCVISVDYRLAPEHPFPAALNDARFAWDWVTRNALRLRIDAKRIAVGGDSAGANLAAVLGIEMRDALARPAYQLLIYPVLDIRRDSESYRRCADGYALTSDLMAYFYRQYLGAQEMSSDWHVSPALSDSLVGMSPSLILVAGFDPLHDEGVAFAQRISASGGRATLLTFARQIHGFITMGKVIDEANDAVALCAAAVRRALT